MTWPSWKCQFSETWLKFWNWINSGHLIKINLTKMALHFLDFLPFMMPKFFYLAGALLEPAHEIMVLFILRKLILQTCMCIHPVGLDVWFFVGPFVYFHTSSVRTVKALVRLRGCAGSPERSLVAYVINMIISWAGSFQPPVAETFNLQGTPQLCQHCQKYLLE